MKLLAGIVRLAVMTGALAGVWWVSGWGWMRWVLVVWLLFVVLAQLVSV